MTTKLPELPRQGFHDDVALLAHAAHHDLSAESVRSASEAVFWYQAMHGLITPESADDHLRVARHWARWQSVSKHSTSPRSFLGGLVNYIVDVTGLDDTQVRCLVALDQLCRWQATMLSTREYEEALENLHVREPTALESRRLRLLRRAFTAAIGPLPDRWTIEVFLPTALVASHHELNRRYGIYLSPAELTGSFSDAFAVFLLGAGQVPGGDGESFPPSLVMARLVGARAQLDAFEQTWNSASVVVAATTPCA